MPSVGPELPPHLAKRKRSITDSNHPSSPPQKIQAATAPRIVGPSLPPKNPDALDLDSSSEDEYGPSAVPAAKKASPSRRVLGPAPPPANLAEMPSHPANHDDSSSDDDYGPSLPPAPGSIAEASMLRQRAEEEAIASAPQEPAKSKRDDWMLVPPSDSDWSSRVDPTKLKNRKFASGKGAKAPAEKSGISAIWTETPEEKRKRLEDQVLGRVDNATTGKPHRRETEEERRTARRIQEYNEKNRGKSLLEEHNERKGTKIQVDDPSQRGFDREKDMALGGTLGHAAKKEMLAKAADFGSRFQKGKYL